MEQCTHGSLPPITAHLQRTRRLWRTAEDTNTPRPALTLQGQGGHCCSGGDCCSQSSVKASSQASCSLKHPPGLSCSHACTQDAEFQMLLEHKHVADVCSIFSCPQLAEVMQGIQEAGWIFPTDFSWIWMVPLLSGIVVTAFGRAMTEQLLAEMLKHDVWHGRTSWECVGSLSSASVCEDWHTVWVMCCSSQAAKHLTYLSNQERLIFYK